MSTSFEVRRGRHVLATFPDAATAHSFAALHAHFDGQLAVYRVMHEEALLADPSKTVPGRKLQVVAR